VFESTATNLVTGDTNLRSDIFVKTLASGAIARISVTKTGAQANDDSVQPVFSPDGTKVAFRSFASNLVINGTFVWQIYQKDLVTGAVTRVSSTGIGAAANGFCYNPVYSHDGTKVAFESDATNLASGDTNLRRDVFVKNLVVRVSSSAAGKVGNGNSFNPVFSPDGTQVAFDSFASNLVTGDTNGFRDVFVKTLATGAIKRVSVNASGRQGAGDSGNPDFSPDGTQVVFWSNWPMAAKDANNTSDIYVKTLASGAVTRLSNAPSGAAGNTSSFNPSFSPDGHSVAFISLASNLITGDNNNKNDIFVRELATTSITRVSVTPSNGSPNGDSWTEDPTGKSYHPMFTADGSMIAFPSAATNLVAGDTNNKIDVFAVKLTGN
jgi:Tol biopolymer transport system component